MSFWRKGDFSNEDILFVLGLLREARSIAEDGSVSISTAKADADFISSVLVSALGLDLASDSLRYSIIRSAMFSRELGEDFSEKDFRKVVYAYRKKHAQDELAVFRVVFPVWNKPNFLRGKEKRGDVTINFAPSKRSDYFRRISKVRQQQISDPNFEQFFSDERKSDLGKCSMCIAFIRASSAADAHERAANALNEALGFLNLAKDRTKHSRRSFRPLGQLPVSEVLIAPHTTVHNANGTLAYEGFWYDEWVGGPNKKNLKKEQEIAWERNYSALNKAVASSNWKIMCRGAAIKYYKAFSNPNLEESFLDGWRLFESISGSRYEKSEIQVNRASNVFLENVKYRILGKHLSLRRNLISHGRAIKLDDAEALAFQMLQFVVPFFEKFLLNGFSFLSVEEFWEFLDLPHSKADREKLERELDRRQGLLRKAMRFRGEADGI